MKRGSLMEKTIKYLENGEYHYATVKDVGDLAKLKTDSKDDLVTAINELFITGGEGPKKPDGYDELVDNVADAIKKQQEMTDTITNMQQNAQLSDADMQHMKQVQEELHQEYLKALKELNEAVDKAKADAADLDKKTSDLQNKLDETFANVEKEVSDVHKQLDSESAGLHKELNDTKTSLEATRKDLLNNTQEFGVVNSEVKELKDKMDRRIWSTDLDPVREQVNKNTTEVSQTKDELKNKADQSSLDLVTNSVENLSTQIKENADGLKVSVKKDELGGDVARLLNDKTNLLLGTRNFSGDSWSNKTHWHEEPGYWKGLKVFSSTEMWSGLQYKYEVKQGQQYTFSFWARQEKDNSSASIVLSESDKGDQGIATPYVRGVHIGTEWKRYSLTFQAESDGIIYPRVEQNVQGNKLYIAGYKLELGSVATPWEPNEADVAENIEHNESQFNVYSDQIAGIVKKQEKMGDTERQLDTRITETAEGLKQTSKDLQDANGKITEFKGQLESTARGLKTEYEKYTNDAIGQISDSSLNLIRNSAFQNKDDNFAQWQNVSAKANIREDSNGLRWVELTQSGMTTDNPQGITSNYFIIKQGKVTVAVDIKLGDKANLDNQNILLLELYNDNKQRVDFTDVSVSQLGLSTVILNDHNIHRGLYRLGIDRKDVKYMTVKAILHRNGDLWFTNFSARLSSIDDGGYTPNPDDLSRQILKMNTKIEEDAEHIALKANSVDVTRDIKSAVDGIRVGGRNLANGTDKEYTMGYGIPNTTWQNGYAYESLPTKILSGEILPQNDQFYANLVPGQEYTQTIWFETDADVKKLNAAITWFTNVGHDEQPAKIIKVGENSYKLFSTYTWPGKTGNNVRLFDIFYLQDAFDLSTGTYIKFGKLKLEEGNVSTDWTPSLQDTSAEIKSAKDAAIQVASDQINLHVNELSTQFDDKLNKRVNEVKTASEKFTSDGIEQVVKKVSEVKNNVDGLGNRLNDTQSAVNGVSQKIDNLQVGGRNLVRNTDTDIVIDDTGNTGTQGWHFATINLTQQPKVGDQITVSAEGTLSGKGNLGTYDVILYNSTISNARSNSERLSSGKRASATLQVNNLDGNGDTVLLIYAGNISDTEGKKNTVHHLKVEFGNLATDWTPAPEDINQKIDTQTLDSANIDEMKTQGHYFVKNLTGNPLGSGWVYVDVIGNNNDRIRQDVYADQNNQHKYRSWNGSRWSGWEQGAYLSDVNNVKTEVTASVKNLGDRVTTEVNSVTSRINTVDGKVNNMQMGGRNLLKGTRDFDSKYWYCSDSNHSALADNPVDSSVKEIHSYGDWASFRYNQTIQLDPNKNYMISADIAVYGNDGNGLYITAYGNLDGVARGLTNDVNLAGFPKQQNGEGFKRVYLPLNTHGKKLDTFRIEGHGNWNAGEGSVFISKIALYEGNTPMAWSDASDDFVEAIKEVNTKWDVANGQIQGKVTETQVQDLLNRGHYATQEWSQGQINLTKDQFNVDIKKVTNDLNSRVNEVKTASEKFTSDGIEQVVTKVTNVKNDVDGLDAKVNNIKTGGRNLAVGTSHKWQSKSDFNGGTNVCINIADYIDLSDVMTGDTLQIGITIKKTSVGSGDASWFAQGQKNADGWDWIRLGSTFYNKNYANDQIYKEVSFVTVTDSIQKGQKLKPVQIRFDNVPAGTTFSWKDFYVKSGTTPTDWTPAPEDVDQQISDKVDTKTLESANIDDLRTQGHYFVHNLAGSPTPGWVYVDVTGNNNDRIRQDVYADQSEIHMYRMRVGTNWSGWSQNAYMSDVNSLRTEVSASVKNLGDRVTTEVNSVTTKINDIKVGGRNYLRNSDKSTSGWAQDLGTMPNEVLNSLAGKTITVSADVEWSNFVSASGVQNRLGFEMSVHRSDGKDQWFGAWVSPTTPNGKERVSTTFDVPAGLTYTVSNNGQNGYVSIK